ncbi:MAG: peptidylprolyl isomerase [Nitrospirota bacterium]
MACVKEGDTIRIHFTGKLEDGTIFDSSEGGASLEFKVGGGEFIKGLEEGVIGMNPGETRTVFIPMEKAFGPHKKEMVFEFDKKRAPENFSPEIGQQMQMYRADGIPVMVTVIGISDDSITMDCNHRLAGKNLIFDIVLEEIV